MFHLSWTGRFSQEFVQARRRGLEKFITRCGAHPSILSTSTYRTISRCGAHPSILSTSTYSTVAHDARRGLRESYISCDSGDPAVTAFLSLDYATALHTVHLLTCVASLAV